VLLPSWVLPRCGDAARRWSALPWSLIPASRSRTDRCSSSPGPLSRLTIDLAARPIYHHTRESIEAHLTIVFAALAVSRWIENTTGWSIRKFVTTTRRYRTITIQAGDHTITAADPIPDDLQTALNAIHGTH
jgi:hypothetical protein